MLADVQKPSCPLTGLQDDGTFRTAVAKEYLSTLNRAFADAFLPAFLASQDALILSECWTILSDPN